MNIRPGIPLTPEVALAETQAKNKPKENPAHRSHAAEQIVTGGSKDAMAAFTQMQTDVRAAEVTPRSSEKSPWWRRLVGR